MNLHYIRIIPDDSPQSAAISMMDLPISEKQIIFSTALISSIAIEALASFYEKTPQEMASLLSEGICDRNMDITTDQVNAVLEDLIEISNAEPDWKVYTIELDSD
ncbi:hypothetical protein [Microcoleus sp. herbarium14]|uniref:hypothetical protein n=1 Tax=Microcoleus sp. herbarium14 TaxID=3055439 RepID=UPI002FD3D0C5